VVEEVRESMAVTFSDETGMYMYWMMQAFAHEYAVDGD